MLKGNKWSREQQGYFLNNVRARISLKLADTNDRQHEFAIIYAFSSFLYALDVI